MKNSIFIFLLAIIICGCDTFNELAKEAKEVAVKSEKVFQGNRRKLMLGIQARYKAEAINVGVSRRTFGNESNEWVSVLVHNGVELSESEEIILAKAVYRQMDTSLVEGDVIEIVQSSQTGKAIRFSSSHSNRYAYHQIDPNVPEPKPIGEETINVVGVLDSLITLNENQCNTKFYKGLLNSWNGNIDQANKDFLSV